MKFRLQRYIIGYKDMASMVTFYRDALGLKISLQDGMPATDWAEFGGMEFKLALYKVGSPGSKGRACGSVTDSRSPYIQSGQWSAVDDRLLNSGHLCRLYRRSAFLQRVSTRRAREGNIFN
ncbi:MAG: hypothetical protein CME19_06840 [Gemmatimonadetes bacterium]|nr:hypothetical protein [Gemmatimonadota bacterium]